MVGLSQPSLDIGRVQTVRKGVLLAAVVVLVLGFVFVASRWPEGSDIHEGLESLGIGLIVVCILGRTWCTLYIGGRKNAAVVAEGPYSISRNPLYVFSFVGAAGVGAQLGSFTITLLVPVIVWAVFRIVVAHEEAHLLATLGEPYRTYFERVPRFLPRWSLWRNVESLEIRPAQVIRTFVDACVFLVAIPVAEGFECLQNSGIIPVLLRVP
jgi:protein-S-isoprenylcysteine O-methyltransferase Ste14